MTKYTIGFRVNDVLFNDTLETKEAALKQAKAWAKAGLEGVYLNDGEREYSIEEFTMKIADDAAGVEVTPRDG